MKSFWDWDLTVYIAGIYALGFTGFNGRYDLMVLVAVVLMLYYVGRLKGKV